MAKHSPRYQFTAKAERDLERLIDYNAREWGTGISQTHTYLDGLESRARLLAENPDLGMARETLFEGLLSFPYESHILYYKKHTRGIVIVRVLHQHMDPVKHLQF
ncbi:MAG: type II toxin-antitoxin system RelE/ParE family toxin [Halioglobus sp.]|nr:type II toxin-antitoxin system RelE/ParE family toxin [Halioglobus sp.]